MRARSGINVPKDLPSNNTWHEDTTMHLYWSKPCLPRFNDCRWAAATSRNRWMAIQSFHSPTTATVTLVCRRKASKGVATMERESRGRRDLLAESRMSRATPPTIIPLSRFVQNKKEQTQPQPHREILQEMQSRVVADASPRPGEDVIVVQV